MESSPDSKPCAPLKSTPSVGRYCSDANWMDAYRDSLSGTTSEPSTEDTGGEKSTLSPPAFPASRIQSPVSNGLNETSEIYGQTPFAFLERLGPQKYCLKTYQGSLFTNTSTLFSGNFPRTGMMLSGKLYPLRRLASLLQGKGFGYMLPSPTKSMASRGWGISLSGRDRYSQEVINNAMAFGYKPKVSLLEAIVGIPITWTELAPLETYRFQRWLQLHGKY